MSFNRMGSHVRRVLQHAVIRPPAIVDDVAPIAPHKILEIADAISIGMTSERFPQQSFISRKTHLIALQQARGC